MIYLDYQATTPLAPEALDAMLPWLRGPEGSGAHANPHSAHRPGRAAKAAVEVAREAIAALLPTGGRVVFTSGATEALNWAIKGTSRDRGGDAITTWATEHAAVLDPIAAEAKAGCSVTILPVDGEGAAVLARHHGVMPEFRAANAGPGDSGCRDEPGMTTTGGLHAAMLVNNEIGAINPVANLADAAHRAGALFLCDAVQGYGRVPIPANVDLVAVSAHKIYGPKGVGALWIRDGVRLNPLLHGGDQEGGRSGTLSPALCAGFGTAARLMRERLAEDAAHVERLWDLASDLLGLQPREGGGGGGAGFEDGTPFLDHDNGPSSCAGEEANERWVLNGSPTHRYRGNLNLRRDGIDVARLMSDCRDIAFSAGSACASGSGRPSHVLRALGLTDAQARTSIRLGWGRYTTQAELSDALGRLDAAARAQRITP